MPGTPGQCEDCRCPRGCEGSGDPPFLLACPLPPFSQSSPSFPPGNRWGGQVTRANAFPEEPWRGRSRDSGEFLAGQDPGEYILQPEGKCSLFRSLRWSAVGHGPSYLTVETSPNCGNRSPSSGPPRDQGSPSGSPEINPEPGPRFPNSLRSQSWFSASSSSS